MKHATITETKNQLSALLDQVRSGETVLILDRGRPIARIESVASGPDASVGRVARLERQGLVRRAEGADSDNKAANKAQEILKESPPRASGGRSATEALSEERAHGR
ncbi:MAG: type II toxin-antitoxin system prevent-host-death family antitoxin [bacterium]|nr:type II toxin-antitoxin system prevent-host-death family antitoxin [bacterium]